MALHLRPIAPRDDAAVAAVIRTVMPEFGCVGEGFSILDPEVDAMSAAYAAPRSGFFVVEDDAGWNAKRSAPTVGAWPRDSTTRVRTVGETIRS